MVKILIDSCTLLTQWKRPEYSYKIFLRESTGTAPLIEAELYLTRRVEKIRQSRLFGVRIQRTFDEATKKYVSVKKDKTAIRKDIAELNRLHAYFSGQPLKIGKICWAISRGESQRIIRQQRLKI